MMITHYRILLIFCGLIISLTPLKSQWFQDFTSQDLSEWLGDVGNFVVNEQEVLQLNASAAGESFIFRSSTIDSDTVSIFLFHTMDFSPSDNNMSKIYLALDNSDPTTANGYFIEIGENGSDDALKFFYLNNGVEELLATASMGAMAAEPATVRLRIDVYPDGLWSIYSNYEGGEFTTLELEFVEDRFSFSQSMFFGFFCKYSASRADKFFFDDMGVLKFEKDITPPEVASVKVLNAAQLELTFSEPVFASEAENNSNYSLDNGIGNPTNVSNQGGLGNVYLLTFSQDFDASLVYELTVSGITDLNDNVMISQQISFLFAAPPSPGDLFLSEILFDPYSGGEDFLEIYNRSNKNLELNGVAIRNDQKEDEKVINASIIIPGDSYLALTEDVDFLFQEYKPDQNANIEFSELPDFNNDMGNAMLISPMGEVLDSFDYHEDQHFQLLDDTEGVSLERLSFDVESTATQNWQSASQNVRFATPGYMNSNFITVPSEGENFLLSNETFSPNQDGEDDQMILNYSMEKGGFVANIQVYDASGFKIKDLSTNELLAVQGIITWDGTDSNGQIADIGIYIIAGDAFHPDGDVKRFKLTTVLADFID